MKPYSTLFEQYKKGTLEENQVETLNQQLMKVYFDSKQELEQEELEYTEDLIFELFSENKLNENYIQKFTEILETDQSVQRKYNLLKNLSDASQVSKYNRLHQAAEAEIADEKEEAELREVLGEVIEKVHSEQHATQKAAGSDNLWESVKSFFESLIPPINFGQPQVQLVMVTVTIVILAVIVWVSVDPLKEQMVSDNVVLDSVNNNQVVSVDSVNLQKEFELKEIKKREKIAELVAANYEPSSSFHYTSSRSVNPSAKDTLIMAAKKYNESNYDSCIIVLNDLIKRKSFKSPDTISMINFYLGNCYLDIAMKNSDSSLIEHSINTFQKISPKTDYYLPSRWYVTFALLTEGDEVDAIATLDSLLDRNYLRSGSVIALRDSILKYQLNN